MSFPFEIKTNLIAFGSDPEAIFYNLDIKKHLGRLEKCCKNCYNIKK